MKFKKIHPIVCRNKFKANATILQNNVTQFTNDIPITQQVNTLSSTHRELTTKAAVKDNKAAILLALMTTSTKEGDTLTRKEGLAG